MGRDIVRPSRRLEEGARERRIRNTSVCIYEHNPKLNNSWKNWFTCLKGIAPTSPCCDILGPNDRYYVGYYTVVDLSKWTDKKGNTYQYEIKLLPARVKTLKKFKMKMEDRKSLVGCLYKASRVDQKSPSCGDEFEFQREVDMGKLFQAAIYKGKKLTEMWAKAQEDADGIEKLKKLFQIKLGPDGKLLPQLPTFNYFKVLEPKPAEEVKEMLGGYHPDDDKPQSNAFAKGGAKSEDVPF